MVRARLPGINTIRKILAGGVVKLYYYHRATKKRLPGKPGSAEFVRAFAEADKASADRLKGTFSSLVKDYTTHKAFEKRAASTQKEYKRMLTKAESKFGMMRLSALEDPRVRKEFMAWRSEVADDSGDREADNRLSVISAMLTWGMDNGKVFSNHVSGFKRLHSVDRSDMIWLPDHIDAFMAVAPIELQRALILALHTGQRQGDLLRLTWNNYDDGFISLRQGKTGTKVEFPCTNALRRMLDGIDRKNAVILTTKTDMAWKPRYFKAQWEAYSIKADAALAADNREATIKGLHFHDLRGTAVTMLAEAGCTTPQIASITGHSLKTVSQILDKYLARTRALASGAVTLFENAKSTAHANSLQTGLQTAPPPKDKKDN